MRVVVALPPGPAVAWVSMGVNLGLMIFCTPIGSGLSRGCPVLCWLSLGRNGAGGVAPARVAGLSIALDHLAGRLFTGAVDLLVIRTVLYTGYEYSFDRVSFT